MDDELMDLAGGNSARLRVLRDSLTTLADGPNQVLREMSRGVLNGETSLRSVVDSDIYGREFGTAFDEFWIRYQAMTGEERDELAALGQRQLDEARDDA
jgi:hypothetical protein